MITHARPLRCRMGNPQLDPKAFPANDVPAPPFAPPAQPGEVRGCATCCRLINMIGTRAADCIWQGRWDWPEKGCDRWGPSETRA